MLHIAIGYYADYKDDPRCLFNALFGAVLEAIGNYKIDKTGTVEKWSTHAKIREKSKLISFCINSAMRCATVDNPGVHNVARIVCYKDGSYEVVPERDYNNKNAYKSRANKNVSEVKSYRINVYFSELMPESEVQADGKRNRDMYYLIDASIDEELYKEMFGVYSVNPEELLIALEEEMED